MCWAFPPPPLSVRDRGHDVLCYARTRLMEVTALFYNNNNNNNNKRASLQSVLALLQALMVETW